MYSKNTLLLTHTIFLLFAVSLKKKKGNNQLNQIGKNLYSNTKNVFETE